MTKTNEPKEPTLGRILDYTVADPDEKIVDFKRRVNEQISSIRIAIRNDDVNDPKIAESYARKAEKFLQIPLFSERKNKDKRVHYLKTECKVIVSRDKEIIDALKSWLIRTRDYKISVADKYSNPKEKEEFNFLTAIRCFYDRDVDFLKDLEVKFNSERILLKKFMGIVLDNAFVKTLSCKNTWKLSYMKKQLLNWSEDFSLGVESELEDIFSHEYFRKKKYLDLSVKEAIEIINIRIRVLDFLIDTWIKNQIDNLNSIRLIGYGYGLDNREQYSNYTLVHLLAYYEKAIQTRTLSLNFIQQEYSLYRFGQGLIEADIFDPLYK